MIGIEFKLLTTDAFYSVPGGIRPNELTERLGHPQKKLLTADLEVWEYLMVDEGDRRMKTCYFQFIDDKLEGRGIR